MSSFSEPLDLALLKSPSFSAWQGAAGDATLPYRLDRLADHGVRVHWTDRRDQPPWSNPPLQSVVRRVEHLGSPILQTMLLAPVIARSPVALAMFESEGNVAAGLRRLRAWPLRHTRLAVISCWLAELLPRFGRRRVDLYRRAYASVDRLYYFSSNQTEILAEHLGLPHSRLRFVPFGVDDEYFTPVDGPAEEFTLVVGRDRGRDWSTLFEAVRATELPVKVLCRPSDIAHLAVPPTVEVVGYVGRAEYRQWLYRARQVAVPTHVLAYPTGQSVVLEAMAAGKCCIVTQSPPMLDYLTPGVDSIVVPPHDPVALADALTIADRDGDLRREIGAGGRAAVEARFTADRMWSTIAQDLRVIGGRP